MDGSLGPLSYQPYNDGVPVKGSPFSWANFAVFEDDLLMTGVRSFDVKAYDDAAGQYVDLGYSGLLGGASSQAVANIVLQTFGHEGRIPPLQSDYRSDAQYPALYPNIGDNNAIPIRLRRVFDTWSTDYTDVAASGVDASTGSLIGPPFGTASGYPFPIYPSYPPPYPIPMRGIQIQIRVVDPRNEHIKVLTIREDFTDKL
jgi:hypothetical protein